MQTIYNIYFELLFDIPLALLLFRIAEKKQDKPVSCRAKLIYCLILFCISYFLNASLFSVILCFITLPLIYSLYVFPKNYRIALRNFFEFVIFYFIIYITIVVFYTLLFNDQDITIISQQYNTYKSAIVNLLTYIIYALTSNLAQINITKNIYILFFNAVIISISVILGYTTLSLNLWDSGSTVLPVIFATIFVLIIICISLYNKFLSIIEENTNYQIKLELDKMEKEYSVQIDDKLKQLHSFVFCNHFLHKVAKGFCRLLHLHFVGNCKGTCQAVRPDRNALQTLFNCYSTRYGNGSSEFSSSCACSLKYWNSSSSFW